MIRNVHYFLQPCGQLTAALLGQEEPEGTTIFNDWTIKESSNESSPRQAKTEILTGYRSDALFFAPHPLDRASLDRG